MKILAKYTVLPVKNIIFEGDSRMFQWDGGANAKYYVPLNAYNSLITSYPSSKLAMNPLASGGRKLQTILADVNTAILPIIKEGDIIVLWEITNQMGAGPFSTAQETFDMIQDYSNIVRAAGAKLVVCTEIARNKAGDAANILPDIQDCNQLIRNAGTLVADRTCDLAANPNFATRAACSNTIYYDPDELHLTLTGSGLAASLIAASVGTLL